MTLAGSSACSRTGTRRPSRALPGRLPTMALPHPRPDARAWGRAMAERAWRSRGFQGGVRGWPSHPLGLPHVRIPWWSLLACSTFFWAASISACSRSPPELCAKSDRVVSPPLIPGSTGPTEVPVCGEAPERPPPPPETGGVVVGGVVVGVGVVPLVVDVVLGVFAGIDHTQKKAR